MSVVELEPTLTREFVPEERPQLRLVEDRAGQEEGSPGCVRRAGRQRVPLEVRRRRTILVLMALLLGALALPLGGAGGLSHAPGSAPAGTGHAAVYVVQPGDTLWTIAERVDPSGDPRPLVARMAARLGTDEVVPGEQITVP
ncbi:MAG TPA: LysM peptidoglycan-binding domain-containing protein [Acidimicrobiales bacterium]|nr:LysM peptidoglycan-binding domain-containing protein [Acidimicrobiales bacterium]